MKRRPALLLLLALVLGTAHARPAWWYLWESKIDGKRACSQTPLGDGWRRIGGPFKDAHCEKLARPQ